MKALKYLSLALVSLFFASCGEDEFEPGKPASKNGEVVAIEASTPSSFVMGLEDESIEVTLVRKDASKAVRVPVRLVSAAKGIFSGANDVAFEAGKTEATYVVKVSKDAKPFQTYKFQLTIDESFTNPYVYDEETAPSMQFSVVKEDYVPYAIGTYQSPSVFQDEWEDVLEYSKVLDTYRFSEWYGFGYPLEFKWNHETNVITYAKSPVTTGFSLDASYGDVVYRAVSSLPCTYSPDSKTIRFVFEIYEPADSYSYGAFADYFVISEFLGE